MAKNTYPSYSVYYIEGGTLKIPYSASKRVQIDTLDEARHAAANVALRYKADTVIVLFTAPFRTRIVEVVQHAPIKL